MAAIGFFKSPTTGNAVTWDETGAQTDTGLTYDGYQLPVAQSQTSFGGGTPDYYAKQAGIINTASTVDPAVAKIRADMGSLKTQDDLNRYFATSGYSPEQFAAAAPQFGGVADYQNAMKLGQQAYNATDTTGGTWANGTVKQPGDLKKYGQGSFNFPVYADGRINTSDPAFINFMNTATPAEISAAENQWNFNSQQTDRNTSGAGVGSFYNNISWMPTDTYAGYSAKYKMGQASQDPTWSLTNGGAAMLTENEYNAQNQRADSDAARGVTFGGGTPESNATQAAASKAYVAAHPLGAIGTVPPVVKNAGWAGSAGSVNTTLNRGFTNSAFGSTPVYANTSSDSKILGYNGNVNSSPILGYNGNVLRRGIIDNALKGT